MGIQFAPLFIPFRRRLQTLAVLQWLLILILMPFVVAYVYFWLMFTPLVVLLLLHVAWLVYDWKTPKRGGRRFAWVRKWRLWEHYRDYFPISLVKTADLDPSRNYILGYHPHGIISFGAFCNFATEATDFSRLYPGITPHLLTLSSNFYWPFLRSYYMCAGVCDVSRDSVRWLMTRKQGGNLAIIVIGGAQEALEAHPGSYTLHLLHRKGFIRQALATGASLIPCYSFGENDLYLQVENPTGSKLRKFQETFKKYVGFSPPLFHGRGVFNYNFGFMPYRHPIVTVVGSPIHVDQVHPHPDEDIVDQLHAKYLVELTKLFDEHKHKYGIPEGTKLHFI